MRPSGSAREQQLAQNLSSQRSRRGQPQLTTVLFRPITLISLLLIGFFAFGALLVLNGFAKDLRKTSPGQATPRSVSAVGYQALTKYLEDLQYDVDETRGERSYYQRQNRLVIYTPSHSRRQIKKTLRSQTGETRLIILPKWSVSQMIAQRGEESGKGWARKNKGSDLQYVSFYRDIIDDIPAIERRLGPSPDANLSFETTYSNRLLDGYAPDFNKLQYFLLTIGWSEHLTALQKKREAEIEAARRKAAEEQGKKYEPKKKKKKKKTKEDKKAKVTKAEPLPNHTVLLKVDGKPVLIKLKNSKTYVLSEPDLVNTSAFQSQGGAQIANAIIDDIIRHANLNSLEVDFDVSLHGIQTNRNLIKLMVTPPFLAATLCLLLAGVLVAWQGFNRFGDPARLRPDYAQGPVSLAQTAAEFMGVANRAHHTGENYAELIRQQVAIQLGYKARTSDHINSLLDAREKRLKIEPTYSFLKSTISLATQQNYGQYAQALTVWRDAMTENNTSSGLAASNTSPPSDS